MSSTITALFDTRAEAEAAKERLSAARVDADNVHVHDKSSSGYSDTAYSTHQERGFWDSIKNAFLPDDDRHTYEEGVRRGGVLLTADVDDDCVDDAVRVLEDANSIDIDERSSQWRASGWNYEGTRQGLTGESARSDVGEREEVIPIVEEQLVVGKRDVDRGSVRVRSYVTDTPVHEQVRLRNERIDVERRAVDQPLSSADADAFRERTIDMTATGEEAVVGKTARVVEEVVVSKTSTENVENVSDTVRRTDVEIERDSDLDRGGPDADSTDRRG